MGQSLADVPLHIVFSTKHRYPFIQKDVEEELYKYLTGICQNLNCPVIQLNGMPDHVHILLLLGRTITMSDLVSKIKSNSSRWIKSKGKNYQKFAWQSGSGTFAVSRGNVSAAQRYIQSQKERHKVLTYQEELIQMLKRAKIPYDERYLWD